MTYFRSNQMDVFVEGTSASVTAIAGNYTYLSIPGWGNNTMLKRIQVAATTNAITGNMDIKILSDPAAYRAAVPPAGDNDYSIAVWNNDPGIGAPYTTWTIDELLSEGVNTWDDTGANCLHLLLYSEGLTFATPFVVKCWGEKLLNNWKSPHSRVGYGGGYTNADLALWRNNSSTNVWTDMTNQALSKIVNRQVGAQFAMTAATSPTEYFYVGAFRPFYRVVFDLHTANTTTVAPTIQYYDGAAWQTATVFNCTDAATSGAAKPFGNSGAIYWNTTGVPTWQKAAFDSTEGTPPDTQPRYWMRFGLTDITTNPLFYSIRVP